MQHHGLPTRLLDWSESPLVACYFAVIECPDKNASLFALNPYLCNEFQLGQRSVLSIENGPVQDILSLMHRRPPKGVDKVIAIAASEVVARMMTQLSAFTLHGNDDPLETHPNADDFLVRFEIPSQAKLSLLHSLYLLGMRRDTLFPDLTHLAEGLRHDVLSGLKGLKAFLDGNGSTTKSL